MSLDDAQLEAELERDMDNGTQPYVNTPTGRLAVPADVMDECGLVSGQYVTDQTAAIVVNLCFAKTLVCAMRREKLQ